MKGNGTLNQIRTAFLAGESREYLNRIYNKGTVTRVYNQLIKSNELNSSNYNTLDAPIDKETKITNLIKEILLLVDKNKEYSITIKFKEDKIENKKNEDLINPFKLAGEVSINKMKEILYDKDNEYIKSVIKKYLKYNIKKLNSLNTKEELIEYIIKSIKKTTSIGESFR